MSIAADKYVYQGNGSDANPGTELLPWNSLSYAATQMSAGEICAVRGSVSIASIINSINSGDLTNGVISFIGVDSSWNDTGVNVSVSGDNLIDGIFRPSNASHIRFKNFDFRNFISDFISGTGTNKSWIFEHCRIFNGGGHGINGDNFTYFELKNSEIFNMSGFAVYNALFSSIKYCKIYNNYNNVALTGGCELIDSVLHEPVDRNLVVGSGNNVINNVLDGGETAIELIGLKSNIYQNRITHVTKGFYASTSGYSCMEDYNGFYNVDTKYDIASGSFVITGDNDLDLTADGYNDRDADDFNLALTAEGQGITINIDAINIVFANMGLPGRGGGIVPSAPVIIRIYSVNTSSIIIEWRFVPAAYEFDLYRCDTEYGSYLYIKTIRSLTTQDGPFEPEEGYWYKIKAKNEIGEESDFSSAFFGRTLSLTEYQGENVPRPDGGYSGDISELDSLTDPCDADTGDFIYTSRIKDSILHFLQTVFSIPNLFVGQNNIFRYSNDEKISRIMIADYNTENLNSINNKPAILINRGPISPQSIGIGDISNETFLGASEKRELLLNSDVTIQCYSKEGLEAELLAVTIFKMIKYLNRDIQRDYGIFNIDARGIGSEQPIGEELTMVPVLISISVPDAICINFKEIQLNKLIASSSDGIDIAQIETER